MKRYKNLSGDSGVVAYALGSDYIEVRFRDGPIYTYTYEKPGREDVERMKALAKAGRGLSTYVSAVVKDRYAFKSDE